MAANTKMATAIQILCVITYRKNQGTTAEDIARSLETNPVVVRRMLKDMELCGLVELRPGKSGGVRLMLDPKDITLDKVYRAIETNDKIFALRPQGNPLCIVDKHMNALLVSIFGMTNTAVETVLSQTNIATLVENIE